MRDATSDDVRYRHETIGAHSFQTAVKVGYAPVSVRGVAVPIPVPVTYVHARDVGGEYWYVVVPARNHESIIVASEAEARALVLENLRVLVGDLGASPRGMRSMEEPDAGEMAEIIEALLPLLPKRRRARWRQVLEGDPSGWNRLDMDDVFLESGGLRSVDLTEALQDPRLKGDPSAIACRFTGTPGYLAGPLHQIVGGLGHHDAVVYVRSGRIVLFKQHDSGWIW
ncbi:MAG: hypothetical protein R3B07_17695 [Polyangiaceae bacterium]